MTFKRKVMIGMVGLLALGVLTACGNSGNASKDKNSNKFSISKEERVKTGTLEVYVPAGKNTKFLQKSLELYNKKYSTELKLKTVDVAPAIPMVQKITPKLVADEKMPDLLLLQDANAGAVLQKFESKFHSSADFGFIDKHGKDFYKAKINMINNIAPSKKAYGFPNDWGNAAMYYNDAAFKKAGVDMTKVKTWDELIEAGKKLKEKTGKNLLFMRDTGELDTVKYLTEGQGVSLFDKSGNLNINDPAVTNAFKMVKKLQDAGIVQYGNLKEYAAIGQKCGILLAGGWMASYQAADYPKEEGQWRIGAMPQLDDSSKNYSPMSGGSSYYVPKKSDNAEAAMQFITFVETDKEALDAYMELSGLPANTTAYKSEVAKKKFAYYGEQQILITLDKISQNSIEGYTFPYSADFDNYLAAASYDIKNNGTSIEAALKKQADEFAAKYNVKVNK